MTTPTLAERAWNEVLSKRGVFVAKNSPLGDPILEARDAAIRAALEDANGEISELTSCLASWQKSAGPNSERVVQQEREITRLTRALSDAENALKAEQLLCKAANARADQIEVDLREKLSDAERERDALKAKIDRHDAQALLEQNGIMAGDAIVALSKETMGKLIACERERDALREQLASLRIAAAYRLHKGHNDTCASVKLEGYRCDCGQDELQEAVAERDASRKRSGEST